MNKTKMTGKELEKRAKAAAKRGVSNQDLISQKIGFVHSHLRQDAKSGVVSREAVKKAILHSDT